MRFVYIRTYSPNERGKYYLVSIEGGTWEEYHQNLRYFDHEQFPRPFDRAFAYAKELHDRYDLHIKIPDTFD